VEVEGLEGLEEAQASVGEGLCGARQAGDSAGVLGHRDRSASAVSPFLSFLQDAGPRTWQPHVKPVVRGAQRGRALLHRLCGDEGGADLLRDAARLAVLHVGAPDVVQNLEGAGCVCGGVSVRA